MKIGIISKTNQKGQIVIPKKMRSALGINADVPLNLILRGQGLYILPIKEVITQVEAESSYYDLLQKTQGAWGKENQPALKKAKKKVELGASKSRRQKW